MVACDLVVYAGERKREVEGKERAKEAPRNEPAAERVVAKTRIFPYSRTDIFLFSPPAHLLLLSFSPVQVTHSRQAMLLVTCS